MSEPIVVKNHYIDVLNNSRTINEVLKKPMGPKLSYWMSKIFKKLQSEMNHLIEEKNKVFDKYALRNENGTIKIDEQTNRVLIDPTKQIEYDTDMRSLMEIETPLEINKIKVGFTELPDMSIEAMSLLVPLFDIDEEE